MSGTPIPHSPYPPNWPDCDPDDPTPPPTTEELIGCRLLSHAWREENSETDRCSRCGRARRGE